MRERDGGGGAAAAGATAARRGEEGWAEARVRARARAPDELHFERRRLAAAAAAARAAAAAAAVCGGEHAQQHGDGRGAADRVAGLAHVAREAGGVLRLYESHRLAVERLDRLHEGGRGGRVEGVVSGGGGGGGGGGGRRRRQRRAAAARLPDASVARVRAREAEAAAPVAEVGGDDDEGRRVGEVRREQRAVPARLPGAASACAKRCARTEEPTRRADDFARRRNCRAAAHLASASSLSAPTITGTSVYLRRRSGTARRKIAGRASAPPERCAGGGGAAHGRRPITCAMYGRWSSSECSRSSTARSIVSNCPVASSAARAALVHHTCRPPASRTRRSRSRRSRRGRPSGSARGAGRAARRRARRGGTPTPPSARCTRSPRAARSARARRRRSASPRPARGRAGRRAVAPRRVPRAGVGGAAAEAGHRGEEAEESERGRPGGGGGNRCAGRGAAARSRRSGHLRGDRVQRVLHPRASAVCSIRTRLHRCTSRLVAQS